MPHLATIGYGQPKFQFNSLYPNCCTYFATNKNSSALATRLLEARKQKGLSQQQVAEIAGVHFTNVGKYERAEAVPSADVFNRIAKALEVSPDFLLNGTIQDKAKNYIQDSELLLQFEKIEKQSKNLIIKTTFTKMSLNLNCTFYLHIQDFTCNALEVD